MDIVALQRWLVSAFSAEELSRVVRNGPHGEHISAGLPTAGSLESLAFEVTLAWSRHGVLDERVRDHLASIRPSRQSELTPLWGDPEPEPEPVRKDGVRVVLDTDPASLNLMQSYQLCMYLGRLAGETVPGANIDVRVVDLSELIGGILATVEVTVFGDFDDGKVAESRVNSFHSRPWSMPSAYCITFDHDDQRLMLTAYAVVSGDHLYPDRSSP